MLSEQARRIVKMVETMYRLEIIVHALKVSNVSRLYRDTISSIK